MSMCRVFCCVVGRGCLLWPVRSLVKTLLAFALLHSVLQGQMCLLLQVFLDFLLLHSSPLSWKVTWSEVVQSCLTLWPHGLWPTRLLCPWDFPGKSTGVGCHFLPQGIFPTQGSIPVSHIVGRCFTIWATREVLSRKGHLFWVLALKDLVALHRTIQSD